MEEESSAALSHARNDVRDITSITSMPNLQLENADNDDAKDCTAASMPRLTLDSISNNAHNNNLSFLSSRYPCIQFPPEGFFVHWLTLQRPHQFQKNKMGDLRRNMRRGAIGGALFAALLFFACTTITQQEDGQRCATTADGPYPRGVHIHFLNKTLAFLKPRSSTGINFFDFKQNYSNGASPPPPRHFRGSLFGRWIPQQLMGKPHRHLGSDSRAQLVVAGQMTVGDGYCNIAQMHLGSGEWSMADRVQLNLYESYSGGEVYYLMTNHSFDLKQSRDITSLLDGKDIGGEELIVVGAFDTTYRNNQVAYCSVGKWDGSQLLKVGEGLCNSALSKGMKLTTAALAGPQDVYVAGSFHTQVWNGDMHEFVKIFNIAHYNAVDQVWLPLPVGQITCSWCTVTVLSLAWDAKREQLHVAGKFNAIDGRNIPAGLAIYDKAINRLVAHPAGGLSMINVTEDGVGTAMQLDEENGLLYVMGSFERLTQTGEICFGIAVWELAKKRWTCLGDATFTVLPSGGGNMLLTRYGLMVSGLTTNSTSWKDDERPYTVALLKNTIKKKTADKPNNTHHSSRSRPLYIPIDNETVHEFEWSWLPGFPGHSQPIHVLSNGFDEYEGSVFIGGDDLVAMWRYIEKPPTKKSSSADSGEMNNLDSVSGSSSAPEKSSYIPVTVNLDQGLVRGSIMAIAQLVPPIVEDTVVPLPGKNWPLTLLIFSLAFGSLIGMFLAVMCNKNVNQAVLSFLSQDSKMKGISLDTLTYSAVESAGVAEAYQRAMKTRFVHDPQLLSLINPQQIVLHRIIGEGTFGRVWSAKWRTSSVAVKEFVFAQAAVAGRSSMQREIVEQIIGEAGMMAILRHPHVLQLYGCSLTAQAIWIVSELCSLGSLRQLLDDTDRELSVELRLQLAVHVAEGMTYLHTQDPPIIHRDLKSHNILVHETSTEVTEVNETRCKKNKKNRDKTTSRLGKRKKSKEGVEEFTCDGNYESFGNCSRSGSLKSKDRDKPLDSSILIAKIGDWGSARAALSGSRTMTHGIGTACWLAPEVIKHARSSKYSDVYSFGIVLWELATREEVYQGLETTQIIARVANDNLRPPVPENCLWKDIMVQCWDENPQKRMTFDKIAEELTRILIWVRNRNRSGQSALSSYQNSQNSL